MDFKKVLMGDGKYPKIDSEVTANEQEVTVSVSMTLGPNHVALDNPGYIETKFKKKIPILRAISTQIDDESGEQTIYVTVKVGGMYRKMNDLIHIAAIAHAICEIAEDRLSEPEVINNIAADCKPYAYCKPRNYESEEEASGMQLPID